MNNKESICNVPGALKLFLSLLKPSIATFKTTKNEINIIKSQVLTAIEELASSLLRSLSVHCSKHLKLRNLLKESHLYTILLDHSLYSSNLNIVANACGILWSMSAKSCEEQKYLLQLGAEMRLRLLAHSTNKLISIICMATLRNLLKSKKCGNSKPVQKGNLRLFFPIFYLT